MAFNSGSSTARAGLKATRESVQFASSSSSISRRSDRTPEPRPTHFIALPIGHHTLLRQRVSTFTDALLHSSPPITGLDKSIVIAPRRLHLTLGVMCLDSSAAPSIASECPSFKTLSAALDLLSELKPRIMEMLQGQKLCIPLNVMDIMKPERGDHDKAHVFWMGPSFNCEDSRRLKRVCEMITKSFTDAGFVTDRRPLKLHCTVINTIHRKPKLRGPRQPFSYKALLHSTCSRSYLCDASSPDFRQPARVNFGTWNVDEVQICKMGSYGPEGEYVSCGGCSLLS